MHNIQDYLVYVFYMLLLCHFAWYNLVFLLLGFMAIQSAYPVQLKGDNYPSNSLPKQFNKIMLLKASLMPFGIDTIEDTNKFACLYFLVYFKTMHT